MLGIYTVFEVSSSLIALIASIATFYWKLYPIIKKMDNSGQITPEGYSKTLAMMISIFYFDVVRCAGCESFVWNLIIPHQTNKAYS